MEEAQWTFQGRQTCRRPDGNPVTGEGYGPPDPPWKSRRARPTFKGGDHYSLETLTQSPAPLPEMSLVPVVSSGHDVNRDSRIVASQLEQDDASVEIKEVEDTEQDAAPVSAMSPVDQADGEGRPAAGMSSMQLSMSRGMSLGRCNRVPPGGFSSGIW